MGVLEDPVAGDVVPGLAVTDVVADVAEQGAIVDADALEEPDQVVGAVGTVRAAVGLASAGWCFRQQFLARVWRVAASAAVGVAADIAVGVADVVLVFGFEFLWRDGVSYRSA